MTKVEKKRRQILSWALSPKALRTDVYSSLVGNLVRIPVKNEKNKTQIFNFIVGAQSYSAKFSDSVESRS